MITIRTDGQHERVHEAAGRLRQMLSEFLANEDLAVTEMGAEDRLLLSQDSMARARAAPALNLVLVVPGRVASDRVLDTLLLHELCHIAQHRRGPLASEHATWTWIMDVERYRAWAWDMQTALLEGATRFVPGRVEKRVVEGLRRRLAMQPDRSNHEARVLANAVTDFDVHTWMLTRGGVSDEVYTLFLEDGLRDLQTMWPQGTKAPCEENLSLLARRSPGEKLVGCASRLWLDLLGLSGMRWSKLAPLLTRGGHPVVRQYYVDVEAAVAKVMLGRFADPDLLSRVFELLQTANGRENEIVSAFSRLARETARAVAGGLRC